MGNKGKFENKEELCKEILNLISQGRSLVGILKSDKKFPSYSLFMEWLDADPLFVDKYARAKQEQADYLAEELVDLADESASIVGDGHDNARIQAARLRVDTRKWVASKLKPKKYGDSMTHKGDAENPLIINNTEASGILNAKKGDE